MSPRRPRFHPRQLVYVLGFVVLALVARDVLFPSGFARTGEARTIFVRPGATIDDIAADLVSLGLLKSPFAFSILARLTRTDRQLKAGQYTFHKGDSVLSILTVFVRGMS
ncbi:MAG: endolytic transglycosylase MltG, partial [Candidatus Eisenbacteria bacterium]